MDMINFLTGRVLWLIFGVAVAVVIAQNVAAIFSFLLAALLFLVIARLAWPSPRR